VEASRGNAGELEAGAGAPTGGAGTIDAVDEVDAADRTARLASALGRSPG
jgi:hypothetical protein